ncbi:hypothetical protein M406DRAFT_245985 [Cryphonectria parasitica EP155]|uniref:Uncharacterized protein n=1 Tax=Cryphonectria parasitica (strain ATCC 38755 / EP155) TaxID=660469 RepID=A0A9P4YBP3_CRYP1|nr:uncharacterized protein M406DRAFT_245985 [Cryphonectria parasitica EP155]KAF3769710.1 hypothetical protein M406DRAFT_245985 [Cryphonectria parasitica EP155]
MVAGRFLAATLAATGLSHATSSDGQAVSKDFGPSVQVAKTRGPQIFNAVHDSMRQWGASLHHNGMSFFLATVPEGVIFHHGNNDERSPDDPDWLAYEIEHAEGFARGGRGPGGGPGKGPGDESLGHTSRRDESPAESKGGWLHTYRTTRTMRYIYIDGMSGGKTTMGTLDSQDHLLRQTRTVRGGGPMDERQRAIEICALCKDWKLDGAVRMEAGFEIIHCDFYDGLEEIQAMQRPGSNSRGPGGGGNFEFLRGLSERYHDIGSSRTNIDYSSMVSAFFFPINLTNPDPARPDLPRLVNTTDAELEAIRGYLNTTIAARLNDPVRPVDWQDVTDIIVARYADRLQYMAEKTTSVSEIANELKFLLTVYIDYSGKDGASEQVPAAIDRCTNFFLHAVTPATESDKMIYAAIQTVTSNICTTLFNVRELVDGANSDDADDSEATMAEAVAQLKGLMDDLSWARFKRCPPCGVDEVCFIPMWPMGTKADYDSPSCVNSSRSGRGDSEGYWGHFGGPGGPGGGRGGKGGPPRP